MARKKKKAAARAAARAKKEEAETKRGPKAGKLASWLSLVLSED
jgi:hypothetical protein